MIEKIIDLGTEFYETGEPTSEILFIDSNQGLNKKASLYKDEIPKKYLNGDYIVLRVIALGAGEFYGSNSNADYFPESELKKRFKSFETTAKVYLYHKNKDPNKSYGDVIKAIYNDTMHRVELIIAIDKRKLPRDLLSRFEAGEAIPFSMGCRVSSDVCSICGNTRSVNGNSKPCSHRILDLGKVYPDGRKVYLINKNPTFYDISIVRIPADKIAYPLEKIAEEQGIPEEDIPLNLDNILIFLAKLFGLSRDYVEEHKSELLKGVEDAMLYFKEHPDDYVNALHLLGIQPEEDPTISKQASEDSESDSKVYYDENGRPIVINNYVRIPPPPEQSQSGHIIRNSLIAALGGALSIYLINKLTGGKVIPNNMTPDIVPKINYGNGIIIDKDPEGHYFIASNTNLVDQYQSGGVNRQ